MFEMAVMYVSALYVTKLIDFMVNESECRIVSEFMKQRYNELNDLLMEKLGI